MSIITALKSYFTHPKESTVAITVRDALMAAGRRYDAVSKAVDPYTTRASHRYAILRARTALSKETLDDPYAATAYEEAVAAYTEPADFEPYTEAYLDAHTTAIDTLTTAFDALSSAFYAFNSADHSDRLYNSGAALYKAYCNAQIFACNAYSNAAHCAMITASQGNLQAAKDEFELFLLEAKAENAAEVDALTAKTTAVAFKVKVAEDTIKTEQLEKAARVAKTKAEELLSKAESFAAIAVRAFEESKNDAENGAVD